MLSIPEFEKRLKGGRYETQGAARRAAWKLQIPEKVRTTVLEGISRHFGEGYKSVGRPETSTTVAPSSFSPKLGDMARMKKTNAKEWRDAQGNARGQYFNKNKDAASVAGRAGGLARAAKVRAEREAATLAAAHASPISTALHIVPPAAPPTTPAPLAPPSVPAPPSVTFADVRAETDRVVRELASRMPAVVPPPPDGVEHAYKMIADSARELFESLAAAVKDEERLRPDLLRAAHSLAMLVETGNDVLLSKLTAPAKPPPEAPKSAPSPMSEAAE